MTDQLKQQIIDEMNKLNEIRNKLESDEIINNFVNSLISRIIDIGNFFNIPVGLAYHLYIRDSVEIISEILKSILMVYSIEQSAKYFNDKSNKSKRP